MRCSILYSDVTFSDTVTASSYEGELLAAREFIDVGLAHVAKVETWTGTAEDLSLITDSKSLTARLRSKAAIDVQDARVYKPLALLKNLHSHGLFEIGGVTDEYNLADALTKVPAGKKLQQLYRAMQGGGWTFARGEIALFRRRFVWELPLSSDQKELS
ncbi:unnamed protein product [Amoebophrya sp. A25]|nr:unnamed protein product [Amoebophrya sp. A25]|eukprot:GSA25T00009383001.1